MNKFVIKYPYSDGDEQIATNSTVQNEENIFFLDDQDTRSSAIAAIESAINPRHPNYCSHAIEKHGDGATESLHIIGNTLQTYNGNETNIRAFSLHGKLVIETTHPTIFERKAYPIPYIDYLIQLLRDEKYIPKYDTIQNLSQFLMTLAMRDYPDYPKWIDEIE